MFLREFEGKELFKEYGIPVPRGILVRSLEEAKQAAKELGYPVAVKAQVTTGGRGKAGLVKLARDEKELEEAVKSILGRRIGDEVVELLLIEEGVNIDKELYLSFTVNGFDRKVLLMASPMGGMDIEEVAKSHPGMIVRIEIDPEFGFSPFMARRARSKRFSGDILKKLIDVTIKLRRIVDDYKLDLAEINPLVITKEGDVLALDSKILVDDSQIRVGRIKRRKIEETPYSFVIINPDGNVGIIGNGAGLVMATCDLVKLMGGEPANFLDVGGGASADVVKAALERIVKDLPNVKVILINIFGGITRGDEVAKGIVQAMEELKLDKPLVVRLVGTNEELGRNILEEHGIHAYKHMEDAIKKAIEIANSS